MKQRKLLFWICALLVLTGCAKKETEPTKPLTNEKPVAAATETVAETEPAIRTVILRQADGGEGTVYDLLLMDPNAHFEDPEAEINAVGADALAAWLFSREAADAADVYASDSGNDLLRWAAEEQPWSYIPRATERTEEIRFLVSAAVRESEYLQGILPAFEEAYGYHVELIAGKDDPAEDARQGKADLVLLEGQTELSGESLRPFPGTDTGRRTLLMSPYVLCGPYSDPAGTGDTQSLQEAFAAVEKAQALFVSCAQEPALCSFENTLWPKDADFDGSRYFSADVRMGPGVIIAEEMDGYVLCDQLTFFIFEKAMEHVLNNSES